MRIEISVSPRKATKYEFAEVALNCENEGIQSFLDFEFSPPLKRCRNSSRIALDFLFIASIVYSTDKLLSRDRSQDNWTREFELEIPVSDEEMWNQNSDKLESCLTFLTGDRWRFHFFELPTNLVRPLRGKGRRKRVLQIIKADAVCLFSGGLDSLVGAIDWLEENPRKRLLLVSHHDRHVAGPFSDQKKLYRILKSNYNDRIDLLQVRTGQNPAGDENTFRSRSILYIALGIYAATSLEADIPLLVPENGTIAINVPLTPSRRGSCSTRTAHPYFFLRVQQLLEEIGIRNPISNPLYLKTKGESLEQCHNRYVLTEAASHSVSCAKRGHVRTWINKSASHCGRCIPCIFRRAALHRIDLDDVDYGRDVCNDEVDAHSNQILADDLRACLSFLRHSHSQEEIAKMILTSGRVPLSDLSEYANLVISAMDEVRTLLVDKGTDNIKRQLS